MIEQDIHCENQAPFSKHQLIGVFLIAGLVFAIITIIGLCISNLVHAQDSGFATFPVAPGENCLSCHQGISSIMDSNSSMLVQIQVIGNRVGDPDGCVVCHGGNQQGVTEEEAHTGVPQGIRPDIFYPDPGSIWIADVTCGPCHPGRTYNLTRSLMQTEAGKIQGMTWAWGGLEGYEVKWGNYDIDDSDGFEPNIGTEAYRAYMNELIAANPNVFPESLEQIPSPSIEEIRQDPSLAAFTYERNECGRCHVGVKGRSKRGDWRGMGCSSCHIPYSNEGLYEGEDPSIPKDEPGHLLVHRIQGTRKSEVTVNEKTYTGIPVETCNSCHNRGGRVGVTYQGLMEFPYGSPYDAEGEKQPKLHTKNYIFIKDDLHHQQQSRQGNPTGGLLCQDCHTSIEIHGDGNIFGTLLAQLEIECADCHGTPDAYPWELPLGFQDEFGRDLSDEPPRGTVDTLLPFQTLATVYDSEDGYLLTSRGNPFGNVIRRGDQAIVHSANGLDFQVPLTKEINKDSTWKSLNAKVAMDTVATHLDKMECYSCHADWAPQCYGCHVTVDYSSGKESVDWIASGSQHNPDGTTAESSLGIDGLTAPGQVSENRSYLRWEEPILGINGEGRVSPLIPGCQVVTTVIDTDGHTLVNNHIWRTPPNTEGAGTEGQRGIDMAPIQPHSISRQARTCESCHANPKALGYGIGGGRFQTGYSQDIVEDLVDAATGEIIPDQTQIQIAAIPDLEMDWSQIVTRDGEQLQTVGSHWPLSRPLDNEERNRMEIIGGCIGCHQNMADRVFWDEQIIAKYGSAQTAEQHMEIINQMIRENVIEESAPPVALYVVLTLIAGSLVGGGVVFFLRRRKKVIPGQ